ncbi:hypothetical protein G6031_05035 [Dietzia sp. CQ4]|uniref:hypothetical protein n=1 Tax=Dietzia sp. (strain CQ4) TaxID=370437 RepID=UPI0015FCDCC1|nr:hypothetical protein [Dietzia sp. CQ4]MBB1033749.1 hypothetical protein [Dietzia sp. CQ4]
MSADAERVPGSEGMTVVGDADVVVVVWAVVAVFVAGGVVVSFVVAAEVVPEVVVASAPEGSGGAEVVISDAVEFSSGDVTVIAGRGEVTVVVSEPARKAMGSAGAAAGV